MSSLESYIVKKIRILVGSKSNDDYVINKNMAISISTKCVKF